MARTVLETIHVIYDARNRAATAEIESCLHPDLSFQILGDTSLGYITEKVTGKVAFLQTLGKLMAEWDLSGFDYRIHARDGDHVTVHRTGIMRHIPTGNTFQTEIVDLITFRDGLVVSFREFVDTQQLARAAGGALPLTAQMETPHDAAGLRQLVEEAYAARDRGDLDGTMRRFADDCTFQIVGNEALGEMSQKIRGNAELRTLMAALIARWDFQNVTTTGLWVDGNTVVARRSGPIRDTVTGDTFHATVADILTFKDGHISAFEEFTDTHMVASQIARAAAGKTA